MIVTIVSFLACGTSDNGSNYNKEDNEPPVDSTWYQKCVTELLRVGADTSNCYEPDPPAGP